MPLELKINDEQKVKITATPVTTAGKPAPLDGPVEFSIIDGDATVERVDDKSAYLVSAGPGDTQFLVKADADLGEGVEEISDTVKLTVVGASAANLGLKASPPELK